MEFLFSCELFENWTYDGDLVKWLYKLPVEPSDVDLYSDYELRKIHPLPLI